MIFKLEIAWYLCCNKQDEKLLVYYIILIAIYTSILIFVLLNRKKIQKQLKLLKNIFLFNL